MPKFPIMAKGDVNGSDTQPIFRWIRHCLPCPQDRSFDDEEDDPIGTQKAGMRIIWTPVTRSDINWNFEKFLFTKDGVPVRRFSPKFETKDLATHIDELLA